MKLDPWGDFWMAVLIVVLIVVAMLALGWAT
jgi:hypothetical protein